MSPSARLKLVASVAAMAFGAILLAYVAWSSLQPDEIEQMIGVLAEAYPLEDSDRVFRTLGSMTEHPPQLVSEAMTQVLHHGTHAERIAVARAISDLDQFYDVWPLLRQPELIEALQARVLDTQEELAVRVAALSALKVDREWTRRNIPLLVTMIDDRDLSAALRREAMVHLAHAGESAADLIPMLLQDVDRDGSDRTYPGDQLWQTLVTIGRDNPRVQELVFRRAEAGEVRAIHQLRRVADRPRALDLLTELLQRDPVVTGEAIEVLRRMGPDAEPAVPALMEQLGRHPAITLAAIEAIGEIGVVTPQQLATLRGLESEDWYWEVVDIIDRLERRPRQ